MILKASQRGGDAALAAHLLNIEDNDHIEVHAINGFVADDVAGAFQEIRAVAKATKCKQYMLSLSLSPPENASVSNQAFEEAIEKVLRRLGLSGQPYVVIFHEKQARRHAHLVVSRIDGKTMKAINLSFFKDRLCDLSRELFLQHGWDLPKGHIDRKLSDPLNYSLEEYQVAQRAKRGPKDIKALLKDCWAQSDSKASFKAALEGADFRLCRGDRRGFVAIDRQGKIYSLSRWLNVKPKDLKARFGVPDHLPSIEEALQTFALVDDFTPVSKSPDPLVAVLDEKIKALEIQRRDLVQRHRTARIDLKEAQLETRIKEMRQYKKAKSPLQRLWQWALGNRDQLLAERRSQLQKIDTKFEEECLALSEKQRAELRALRLQIADLHRQREALAPARDQKPDIDQFIRKPDPYFLFHQSQIDKSPDYVLRLISDKKETFSRQDIIRQLSDYISDPTDLREAIDCTLQSS